MIIMNSEQMIKEMVKMMHKLSARHNTWQVFMDFVEIAAIAISNSVDKHHFKEREDRYLTMIKPYNKEELELMAELMALLTEALEYCVKNDHFEDILGQLFHELELHNKYKGQFFTPSSVCDMMGKMVMIPEKIQKDIQEKGYIAIHEPACGGGAMIFGAVNGIREIGLNHSKELFVHAIDVDLKCVHMAYVQLSLYGIPAIVIHGNTLSMEEWSRWYTPVYFIDGWQWKRRKVTTNDEVCLPEVVAEPIEKVVMEDHTELEETDAIKQDIPSFEVEANGQMTLFS